MAYSYEEGIEDGMQLAREEAWAAINQIRTGRYDDAIVTLERAFLPTWEDTAACEARYREVMGRGHAAQAQEAA